MACGGLEFYSFVKQAENQLWRLFQAIDHDKNGHLDKQELKDAFSNAGLTVPSSKLDQFFADVDTNRDGVISFDEWRYALPTTPSFIHCHHTANTPEGTSSSSSPTHITSVPLYRTTPQPAPSMPREMCTLTRLCKDQVVTSPLNPPSFPSIHSTASSASLTPVLPKTYSLHLHHNSRLIQPTTHTQDLLFCASL